MGVFVLAQLFEDETLAQRSSEVLVYLEGRFQSVEEIFERCAAHGWNSTIYEAWAYVTAQNVRSTARTLGPIVGKALLVYAQSLDVMDMTRNDAIEAIGEAQEALYGVRTAVLL